jgi:hypothetical protein
MTSIAVVLLVLAVGFALIGAPHAGFICAIAGIALALFEPDPDRLAAARRNHAWRVRR